METVVEKVATQVPSLAVLVFVVWLFIKDRQQASTEWRAMIKEMHQEHVDARNQTRAALKHAADAMEHVAVIVSHPETHRRK